MGQAQRERQEKIRQRKLESKRVDHLARAMREEEKDKLDEWADDTAYADEAFLKDARARDHAVQKEKHTKAMAEKDLLIVFQEEKDTWMDKQLEAKYTEFREQQRVKRQARMDKEVA